MIRVVAIHSPDGALADTPPHVEEHDEGVETMAHVGALLLDLLHSGDVASFSVQRVTQWWPATWRQVLPGCEVQAPDGSTWVCARGLSPASPHEVEIYKFGQPEIRHTFTPLYDAPVMARFTHEASMMALLMTELGARVID